MQSIRPLKIIVNVSYDDKDLITEELRFFEKFNVEFYFCDDIKSFKPTDIVTILLSLSVCFIFIIFPSWSTFLFKDIS